jgi:hypothetical protein
MNDGETHLTAVEQAAFDRVIAELTDGDNPRPTSRRVEADSPKPSLFEETDAMLEEMAHDELVPGLHLDSLDFVKLGAEGVPEPEYLEFPYLPRSVRVWVFGPAEASKTIYHQWLAAKLTRAGRKVVFVSQENPLATDVDRMLRLRPDFTNLDYFHMPGLDLADSTHFVELARRCVGHDVVVIDTLSACWSGDEGSNADVGKLDRQVLAQLVKLTGATIVLIHHTGHPQAFVNRGGAGAGRGASSMGQKADVVLVFQPAGPHEFTIDHSKNRTPGGYKEPRARFRVVDTDDCGLDIERVGKAIDERVAECMDAAVEIVAASDGTFGTNALEKALNERGFGGSTVTPAKAELKSEDPPRIRQIDGEVTDTAGRRRKGRPWVVVEQ